MKLKKLIKDIPIKEIKGSKEIEITGICADSRRIAPHNLFVAKKGVKKDGARYISAAIEAGASAILTDIYDPSLKTITQLIDPEVIKKEADIAAQFYHFPSEELFMVGITGTNGKTTTSFFVKHLLESFSISCGIIGTIEYMIGEHRYQASNTTPDVITNHKMLREMVLENCKAGVMEVSSHGLEQERVRNIDFDVAVFTNLTLEHLDYHQTMENYAAAKNKLFRAMNSSKKKVKKAVVNIDSPWSEKILEGCTIPILSYGLMGDADLKATEVTLETTCSRFQLNYQGRKIPCIIPLIGRHNIYNCLAAIGVGLSKGYLLEELVKKAASFPAVPGRLERVLNPLNLNIYVDFAHSDDSLTNVLECLDELKKGKIITVFGCGGDRDRLKRPKMAKAAEKLSHLCIVTSDNPRSETPESICQEIIQGFASTSSYTIELDRRKAIEKAIQMASLDDIILIAGKGHEPYQIFSHKTIEFDDRKVALESCFNQTR